MARVPAAFPRRCRSRRPVALRLLQATVRYVENDRGGPPNGGRASFPWGGGRGRGGGAARRRTGGQPTAPPPNAPYPPLNAGGMRSLGDCPRVANCVQHLQGILDALYKCAVDPDPTLRLEVLYGADWGGGRGQLGGRGSALIAPKSVPGARAPSPTPQALYTAELVGRFIAPEHYLPLAIPSLHQPQPNPEACRGGGGWFCGARGTRPPPWSNVRELRTLFPPSRNPLLSYGFKSLPGKHSNYEK